MYFEEGLPSWFKGVGPNMIRAILLNGSVLTVNEIVGKYLESEGYDDHNIKIISSSISGCVSSIASLPADNCKCRLQSMRPNKKGE